MPNPASLIQGASPLEDPGDRAPTGQGDCPSSAELAKDCLGAILPQEALPQLVPNLQDKVFDLETRAAWTSGDRGTVCPIHLFQALTLSPLDPVLDLTQRDVKRSSHRALRLASPHRCNHLPAPLRDAVFSAMVTALYRQSFLIFTHLKRTPRPLADSQALALR